MAFNRPVAEICADRDGRIVAAFRIMGAGAIATVLSVVISGGPQAGELTGEGSARVSKGPARGLSGAPSSRPRRAYSVSNCDIQGFLLLAF